MPTLTPTTPLETIDAKDLARMNDLIAESEARIAAIDEQSKVRIDAINAKFKARIATIRIESDARIAAINAKMRDCQDHNEYGNYKALKEDERMAYLVADDSERDIWRDAIDAEYEDSNLAKDVEHASMSTDLMQLHLVSGAKERNDAHRENK